MAKDELIVVARGVTYRWSGGDPEIAVEGPGNGEEVGGLALFKANGAAPTVRDALRMISDDLDTDPAACGCAEIGIAHAGACPFAAVGL